MKRSKIITYTLLLSFSLLNTSCDLADVTDVNPVYQVSEEKVITNLNQAQTALYGVYGVLKGLEYPMYTPAVHR